MCIFCFLIKFLKIKILSFYCQVINIGSTKHSAFNTQFLYLINNFISFCLVLSEVGCFNYTYSTAIVFLLIIIHIFFIFFNQTLIVVIFLTFCFYCFLNKCFVAYVLLLKSCIHKSYVQFYVYCTKNYYFSLKIVCEH